MWKEPLQARLGSAGGQRTKTRPRYVICPCACGCGCGCEFCAGEIRSVQSLRLLLSIALQVRERLRFQGSGEIKPDYGQEALDVGAGSGGGRANLTRASWAHPPPVLDPAISTQHLLLPLLCFLLQTRHILSNYTHTQASSPHWHLLAIITFVIFVFRTLFIVFNRHPSTVHCTFPYTTLHTLKHLRLVGTCLQSLPFRHFRLRNALRIIQSILPINRALYLPALNSSRTFSKGANQVHDSI